MESKKSEVLLHLETDKTHQCCSLKQVGILRNQQHLMNWQPGFATPAFLHSSSISWVLTIVRPTGCDQRRFPPMGRQLEEFTRGNCQPLSPRLQPRPAAREAQARTPGPAAPSGNRDRLPERPGGGRAPPGSAVGWRRWRRRWRRGFLGCYSRDVTRPS